MVTQTAFYPRMECCIELTLDSRTLCPLDCRWKKKQVRPAHGLARRGAASTSGIILKTIDLSKCDCPASRTRAFLCAPALVIGSQTTGGASLESGLRPPCTRHAACHPHSRPIRPLICIPPRVPAAGSSKAPAHASRTRQTCSKEVRVARGRGRPLGGGGEAWRELLRVEWGGSLAGAPGTSGKPGLRAGRAVVRSCDPPDGRCVVRICMFSVHDAWHVSKYLPVSRACGVRQRCLIVYMYTSSGWSAEILCLGRAGVQGDRRLGATMPARCRST